MLAMLCRVFPPNLPRRLAFLLILLATTPAAAETLFTVPPGGRLAIEQSLDDATWAEARRCLPSASTVGAQYYAVVVNELDAPGRPEARPGDAVPFVDSAYTAWRAADTSVLDPDRHVLIGLAIEDRAVAIHPGHEWAEMGLEGPTITRVIDGSEFSDRARSGDLARAVCTLADAVDSWIVGTLRQQEQAREAAAAQLARQREAAAAKLAHQQALRQAAPFVVFGVVLLITFLVFLLQLSRVRRLKHATTEEIEEWRAQLSVAAERLLELERLHPVYFTAAMRRWTGRSLELDRNCADAVNRVYLLYSRASLLADRAADELRVTGSLRMAPVRRARSFLHTADVVIEEGVPAEGEDRRRIFVPLLREVRTTADQVLAELDTAYGEALDQLSHVAELEEHHDVLRRQADAGAESSLAAISARRELGLPVSHLDKALESALSNRDRARGEFRSDPLAAVELLEPCVAQLQAVAARAELGNRAIERLRTHVTGRAQALRRRIDELREQGYRLEEPGFQADLQLDRGAEDAEALEAAVAEGHEEEARQALDRLEEALDDLSAKIEASAAARDGIPRDADALDTEIAALRDKLPTARQTLDGLARRHAPRSWEEESDNVEEIKEILDRLDQTLARIRDDHAHQNYLAALEDLTTCRALLDDCHDLLGEIEVIETVLEGCKSRSLDLARQVDSSIDELLRRRDEKGVGTDGRRQIDELAAEARPLVAVCTEISTETSMDMSNASDATGERETEPPDWTDLEPRLAALRRSCQDLAAEVTEDLAGHAAARKQTTRLTNDVHELLGHVRLEERDRPHVESSVREVADGVEQWTADLEADELGGRELFRRCEQLAARLEWARGVWRSEMDLVRHAETTLRAAEHAASRQLGRSLGHGIVVSSSSATRALERARNAAGRKEWEAVVEAAQTAQAEIDDAVAGAEVQYRNRERAERRKLAAAAAMEALRIGVTVAALSGGRGRRGGRRTSLPSWPSRSSASSSMGSLRPASRGGGTRASRPSGGRSGGGWGGSRSGGSRW